MLILKEYNLVLTSSRPTISTHLGIGFIKTHIIFGQPTTVNWEITTCCIALLIWADPDMLQFMQYHINQCDALKGETYRQAKEFGQKLPVIDNTREVIGKPLMYKDGVLH